MRCAGCGEENPVRARFCLSCGVPLTGDPPVERRKLATMVFCDVVGSTALGETRDPEAVRSLMSSYFGLCRGCIERHGGTVEKFIGDAVMAVFGVPVAHEDDPVRAVAAATDIRMGVEELAGESVRRLGRPWQVRIGIATGEVVAGDDASRMTMVTGDAVNTAARLEAAAGAGEVLVDGLTAGLVVGTAACEPVGSLVVKGRSEPVQAFRVVRPDGTGPGAPRRAQPPTRGTAMVGRDEERERLVRAWSAARRDGIGDTVTVVGEAGVGKSLLVREAVARMPGARVLRAVCPPYGEAMTYYPLRELLGGAGLDLSTSEQFEADVGQVLGPDGDPAGRVLARAVGLSDGVSTPADIAWATRRWLQGLASGGPVVLVVDDVQWAQPALRELLLAISRRQSGPVLLVCLARPELLESEPGWPGVMSLDTLARTDVDALARQVLGDDLAPDVLEFVANRSGGNPLFAQELAENLRSQGLVRRVDRDAARRWESTGPLETIATVPTTLTGLLAARLDRTPPLLRTVLECGAVEGEAFHAGAVDRLAPDGTAVSRGLDGLRRERLVVPDAPVFVGEEAYRFHHLLLRDAAYRGLSKTQRADLHARYAAWVVEQVADRVAEFEEVVAHHLEQALGYRREVRGISVDDEAEELRLGSMQHRAGNRAAGRGDATAAVALLGRASVHLAARPRECALALLDLGQELWDLGELDRVSDVLRDAARRARSAGDDLLAATAEVQRARLAFWTEPHDALGRAREVSDLHEQRILDGPDERAKALLRMLQAETATWASDFDTGAAIAARAVTHARASGDEMLTARLLELTMGSWALPLGEIERRCGDARQWARDRGLRHLDAAGLLLEANVAAQRGETTESIRRYEAARRMLIEIGAQLTLYQVGCRGLAAEVADDLDDAEVELREAIAGLEACGERAILPTMVAHLGRVLCLQGRLDEAEECATIGRRTGALDDVANEAEWRAVQAMVLLRRGRPAESVRLAQEALGLSRQPHGYAAMRRLDLAELFLDAGRADLAGPLLAELRDDFARLELPVLRERAGRLADRVAKQ